MRLVPLALVVVLSPVLTWWLIGDLSDGPDYMMLPPNLSATTELAIGLTTLCLSVAGAATSWILLRQKRLTAKQIAAAAILVLLGAYIGLLYRALTAGGVGANIGAGILLNFGLILVPGAIALAWYVSRDTSPPPPRPQDHIDYLAS